MSEVKCIIHYLFLILCGLNESFLWDKGSPAISCKRACLSSGWCRLFVQTFLCLNQIQPHIPLLHCLCVCVCVCVHVCVSEVCVVCVCVAGDYVVLAKAVVNLFSRSAAYIPPLITTLYFRLGK